MSTKEERECVQRLVEAHYRELDRIGYINTPVDAVRNALDLFIYALHVHEAVNAGRVTPANFARPLRVHTGGSGVTVAKEYTPDQFRGGAWNLMLSALSTSAIATDTALEALGPRNAEDIIDVGSARNIIYMIRNAFAHNPFYPRWRCETRYQRLYRVAAIGVAFDGAACNGQDLKPEAFGGIEGYFALLFFCLDTLQGHAA